MSRRRQNANPISLFAFQDIITAVTGILILITLLLAIAMIQQPVEESAETRQDINNLKTQLAELQNSVQQMEKTVVADKVIIELMAKFQADSELELKRILNQETKSLKDRLAIQLRQNENTSKTIDEIKKAIERKKTELGSAREKLLQCENRIRSMSDSNRIVYRVTNTNGRHPWLVELNAAQWRLAPSDRIEKPTVFDESNLKLRLRQMESWFASLPQSERFLVLVLKPGGIESMKLIRESTNLKTAEFGTDIVGKDVAIMDETYGVKLQ